VGRSNKQNRPWRRKRKRTNRAERANLLVGHTHTCIGYTRWLWLCCRLQQHVWQEAVGCVRVAGGGDWDRERRGQGRGLLVEWACLFEV
jgi:hypothetical protein